MAAELQSVDIPVWFNGTQRWMTGVTRRTTCDDVIYALLVSTGLQETESTDTFAIFEKWREVERPLSARTKILKVWTFWGEEQPNVQLSMRSLEDYFLPGESSLYTRSRRRHKKSSRHKERHSTQCRHHNKPGYTECSRFRTLEQLVKLVVSQERKMLDLNDRIHETDKLIDKHESRIHLHRVQQNGMDYVQNSYLNSHSSESSSSADSISFSSLDLRELNGIFPESNFQQLEEIVRVCDNMSHLERRIVQEHAKIKELTTEADKLAESTGAVVQLEGETNTELEEARVQMIRAVATYVTNEYNERELDRKIDICLAEITAKTEYINEIQRKLSNTDQREVSDTELPERCTNHENNSNNQHPTSSGTLPVQTHNYNYMNAQHDARYEDSQYSSLADEDNSHYPNRHRNIYNISGQFLKSLHLDNNIQAGNAEIVSENSSARNALVQDKSLVIHQSYANSAKYSDETFADTFSREGRSTRKSNRALQRPSFGRSRSAERSTDVNKLNMTSDNGRFNGRENSILSRKSESYTTKAVVDQYGLEMSTNIQGPNLRDSFRNKTNLLSNSPSHSVPATACLPQNQLVNSGHEHRYQQQKQQTERNGYEDTTSKSNGTFYNESGNRIMEENSHRSGAQIFSHGYARDLRTSINNPELEDRPDTQSASLYTFGDRENRILGGEDGFLKDRSLFEQNVSGLSRIGSNSDGSGVHRGAINTEVRNSPTSNRTFDLTKVEGADSPDYQHGYHSPLVRNNIHLSTNVENVQLQDTTGVVKNMAQLSSPLRSGIITNGKQTTVMNPDRKTTNPQIERQTRTQQTTDDIYRQQAKENKQFSHSPCWKYQVSSQQVTAVDSSPRQQLTSRLSDTYSTKPVRDNSLRTHPNQFTDTNWDERSGMCLQNESVNNTQKVYSTQQLQDITVDQHKKVHFSSGATVVHSNSGVLTENISSSHSLNPVVKSSVTPKMSPSIISNKEAFETNICAEDSGDASRGALYHIVSNKLNKTKSGSVVYQHDKDIKCTGSDTSPNQHSVHIKPNIDVMNSVKLQYDISHNKVKTKNSGQHVTNPASCSFHNGEYNNEPPTISHSNGHQHHVHSAYNKDRLPSAPLVVSNNKITRLTSDRPKGPTNALNHQIYETAVNTRGSLVKHNMHTSTSLGMNSAGNVQSSSISFQNSVNHTNGYHIGGYRAGRTNAVTIKEIREKINVRNYHPHNRGNSVDVNVPTNGVDARERTKLEDVNDSNSDTGLSSMHSDETPNIETLV